MQTDEYFFFYRSKLSQWHMVNFLVEGVIYCCCEQYMMAKKAVLFNDMEMYLKIMKEKHPRQHQSYGRQVKNFDISVWDSVAKEIVYNGNYARFIQNEDQKNLLLDTKGLLVEASDIDMKWGCGVALDDPKLLDKKNWIGKNWLGEILTAVREDIKNNTQENKHALYSTK